MADNDLKRWAKRMAHFEREAGSTDPATDHAKMRRLAKEAEAVLDGTIVGLDPDTDGLYFILPPKENA